MPRGVKIADVWVEATLDKSGVRREAAALSGELAAEGDKAGKAYGDNLSRRLTAQVEQLSSRLAKARLAEQKATDAVTLAQTRLTEAEQKGNVEGSRLLALQQRLSQAQAALAIAHDNTAKATTRHAEAERRLADDVANLGKASGPAADRAGRDTGDKLSQGIHRAIVRNSPLIAAGIGAALAAGAPVAIAAATALFATVGIVAAAQSEAVKNSWGGLWRTISSETQADASVMEGALVNMAARVAAGFEQMRPALRSIFADAAPLMENFVGSLMQAANNAMPGFMTAISNAGPVMQGLGSFMERLGTGLGDFFAILSEHSQAAGTAMDALGRIVGALLPILAQFLGAGAELASVVLPPLASILEVVAGALESIAPILPIVAAGFLGLKAAQGIGSLFETLGGKIKTAGEFLKSFVSGPGSAQEVKTLLQSLKGGLGAVAAGVGVYAAAMMAAEQQTDAWANALMEGGNAAAQAQAQMASWESFLTEGASGIAATVTGMTNYATALGVGANASDEARQRADELFQAMSPLQQAQSKVAEWTNTLAAELQNEANTSSNVEAAKRRLAYWSQQQAAAQAQQNALTADFVPSAEAAAAAQEDLATALRMQDASGAAEALARYKVESGEAAREQNALEMAIYGVSQALADQANQARSRVDANFAYQDSLNRVEDAQKALDDAIREHGAASEEAQRATLDLNQAYADQVDAAQRIAMSDLPASMNDTQKEILGAKAALDELNAIMASGVTLPPELEAYRQQLIQITGQADGAALAQAQLAAAVGELGFNVTSLPDNKTIQIEAPTDELLAKLQDLGFTVTTLPDGSVQVTADTDEAKGNLGTLSELLAGYANSNPSTSVDADTGPAQGKLAGILATIGTVNAQTPTPNVGINKAIFDTGSDQVIGRTKEIGSQTPTPAVRINKAVFDTGASNVLSQARTIDGQTPTPKVGIAKAVFDTGAANVLATARTVGAQNPIPRVGIVDGASGTLSGIIGKLAAIQSKTVTITTVHNDVSTSSTRGMVAGGGRITPFGVGRALGGVIAAAAGRVVGPGGPTDDLVPAIGPGGSSWRLSNGEWVIREAAVRALEQQYGKAAMPTINSGRLPVATDTGSSGSMVKVRGGAAVAAGVTIYGGLTLQIVGAYNLGSDADKRRLLQEIRDGLRTLDREVS